MPIFKAEDGGPVMSTPDDVPELGRELTPEVIEALAGRGMVRKADLEVDGVYLGRCRNATIAKWEGDRFIHWRCKFGSVFEEHINHPEDDNGFDLFVPIRKVDAALYVQPQPAWKNGWRHESYCNWKSKEQT